MTAKTAPEPAPAPSGDSVWQKYSPRHEFPVAGSASLMLHVLVIAGVLLSGLALNARWHGETSQPPKLDIAYAPATRGDGLAPGGGSPPGPAGNQTERSDPNEPPKIAIDDPKTPTLDPIPPPKQNLVNDVPTIGEIVANPNFDADFKNLQAKLKDTRPTQAVGGVPNPGQGGGVGTGKGPGVGPGVGIGGLPGGSATRAEILAQRWRFNLTGAPPEHVKKLLAAGITLGFKDGNNQFWVINDLKRRPVQFRLEPLDTYKDNVKWYSQDPRSVLGLSRELGLPGPPQQFVLLLPREREQSIAQAEFQFAKDRNRDLRKIDETWFDFRLRGGAYEPTVISQVPLDPRPKW